jgi:hypothetical protein
MSRSFLNSGTLIVIMKPTGTYRNRMTFYEGFVVDGPGQLSSKMYDSGNKADSIASHKQSARDDN